MIAVVRAVIAAATAAGSTLKVSGSMSTSTGVAPTRETQPAVAKNEKVGVITSSPGPIPSAISAASSASVPDERADGVPHAEQAGEIRFEPLDLGTADEPLAVADPGDRREDLVPKGPVLRLQIEQRDHARGVSGGRFQARPRAANRCGRRTDGPARSRVCSARSPCLRRHTPTDRRSPGSSGALTHSRTG